MADNCKNVMVNFRVMVKMKNLLNGNTWLWERGKFMNRRYLIQVRVISCKCTRLCKCQLSLTVSVDSGHSEIELIKKPLVLSRKARRMIAESTFIIN